MSVAWYVAKPAGGQLKSHGPTSFEHLRQLAAAGKLQPTDLLCQEGMEEWLPAKDVEGLFPSTVPALPPLPPPTEPGVSKVIPGELAAPAARNPTSPDPRPAKQSSWPLTTPLTILLAAVAGGGFLVVLLCAGWLLMQSGDSTGPVANQGGGSGGGASGGGGFMLQGTYQRRSNDGTVLSAYITFTADGRFEEQGFLNAAAVQRQVKTADGQVWQDWGNAQQGGQGTYQLEGTTLQLSYTTGAKAQMSCHVCDGGGQELLINTHYTFVRVR
jgi:hypothetical protein